MGPHRVPGRGTQRVPLTLFKKFICAPKQTHRVFPRTHRVCRRTQWVLSSETLLSKQYSACFLCLQAKRSIVKWRCPNSLWIPQNSVECLPIPPQSTKFRYGTVSPVNPGGGQNVPNARGGGELAPKVVTRRLGLWTPKLAIFYRISVENFEFQGPLEIQNFHPPSNFRRFDPPPPIPVSNQWRVESNPTIRAPPPQKPWWTSPVQSWGWCTFCCSLGFWHFVHHPLRNATFWSEVLRGVRLVFCLFVLLEEENLGHSIQRILSKFGHSSEFTVFSLENIENFWICALEVFVNNLLFAMAQVFFISNFPFFLKPRCCKATSEDLDDFRRPSESEPHKSRELEKVQGATRLGATGPRASEREICLCEGLWDDLQNFPKPPKTSKNLWKPLKTLPLGDPLRDPLKDPLSGRFSPQRLSVLLPLFVCPLKRERQTSPKQTHLNDCKAPAATSTLRSKKPSDWVPTFPKQRM